VDETTLLIDKSVEYVKNNYYKLMFKTKKSFFKYLNDEISSSDFKQEIDNIWQDVDNRYLTDKKKDLEKLVADINTKGKKVVNKTAKFEEVFKTNDIDFYIKQQNKFINNNVKYYEKRLETIKSGNVDKSQYLAEMVDKYDEYNKSIPYYNANGSIRSWHNIGDYLSMVYNSDLTRSGWNRTAYDSKLLDNHLWYLPAHNGACPLCMKWQGKIYKDGGDSKYTDKKVAIAGGVGHPNCRHQWTLYWGKDQLQKNKYNDDKWLEFYKKEQKIKALELEAKKSFVNMKILKDLDETKYQKERKRYLGLRQSIRALTND